MELNEKLARWAGFYQMTITGEHWYATDGMAIGKTLIDFTSSLDACFKWLVPKLEEWSVGTNEHFFDMTEEEHHFNRDLAFEATVSSSKEGKWLYGESMDKTPALALCKAIEQLVDKETNGS